MDLSLDEQQQAVDELFGPLLAKECPPEVVRDAEPLGFAPGLWETLAGAGGAVVALPEACGGGGLALLETALLAEHVGRHVAPVPLVEHSVASRLLAALDPDAGVLPALAAGERIAALALRPAVDGVARLVPGGAVAGALLALDGDAVVLHGAIRPAARRPISHRRRWPTARSTARACSRAAARHSRRTRARATSGAR